MRKTAIAPTIIARHDRKASRLVGDGPLAVAVAELLPLSLVPFYCDVSVHWAFRLTRTDRPFTRAPSTSSHATIALGRDGSVLIGVSGDGSSPPIHTLRAVVALIGEEARPGMVVELATANLGVVLRDRQVKAPTRGAFGAQRYVGTVDARGRLSIERATPTLTRDQLVRALECARVAVTPGPWKVKSKAEAHAIIVEAVTSPTSNINGRAVGDAIVLEGKQLVNHEPKLADKIYALGLGFFRHRMAGGPFRWTEPYESDRRSYAEAVADVVVS